MESIELGASGLRVTRIGFGGCPLGGHGWGPSVDTAEGKAAVRAAFELGVNFFDTADVYGLGRSESLLAEVLGPHLRDVVVASKFGVRWDATGKTWKDISPKYMAKALEASLRRLKLDSIPLYYAHWPDQHTPVEEVVAALDRMRQAGKIQAIGLSNFSAADIARASDIAPISALQLQYSLVNWKAAHEVLSVARERNIPFVTWGSLAQGLLSGKYDKSTVFGHDDRRSRYDNFRGTTIQQNLLVLDHVKQLASLLGCTPAQVAIRWLLQSDNVGSVLVGAKRPSQIEENVAALHFQMSSQQYDSLSCAAESCLSNPMVISTPAGAA